MSLARGSSRTATVAVSSPDAISFYEWLMKRRSEEASSNPLPSLGSAPRELVLILIGLCPWVNTAMQGKICSSPLHLHPAEPHVSVELCSPAESRIV